LGLVRVRWSWIREVSADELEEEGLNSGTERGVGAEEVGL
jgi:hypothetical protein